MASNKKKQDEKHLKMLREMVALPSNKTCFDCHQRGPTYVDMTIGSFVCTSCSGILRGLNPPHRVKSISMASFTPDEMDFLKAHGNELNRKVYLGLYDNRTWPEPDSRDEQRVRDFMVQKYENKRFYVAPTEAMRDEARRMNDAALSKQPQTKPLRALLGENATRLVVGNSQTSQTSSSSSTASHTMAASAKSSLPPPVTAQSQQAQQAPQAPKSNAGGFDLLGDLGSDPFASSTPASSSANTGGFADFSNFGSAPIATPPQPAQPAAQPVQPAAPTAFPPMPSAPLQPFTSGGGLQPQPANSGPAPSSAPSNPAPSSTNFSAISDKYAALADLDSTFNTPVTQAPATVNWGGTGPSDSGAGLNWGGGGGGGSTTTAAGVGSGDGGSLAWGGQSSAPAVPSSAGGGMNWNSGGGMVAPNPAPSGAPGGMFGAATTTDHWHLGPAVGKSGNPFMSQTMAANPFGTSTAAQMPQGQVNPFGASQQPGGSAGFGFPQQQFPVQNGGFAMATTASGFAPFGAAPPSTAPPSYGVAQQQGFQSQQGFPLQQQQQGGFPPAAQQQGFGAWGQMSGAAPQQQQQPGSANPFMSAVNQQQAPPRGASTNPFL